MNVGFVGMGSMGHMLVTALAGSGALHPGQIVVSNRSPAKLTRIAAEVPGIQVAPNNAVLATSCRVIFLCTKPGETAPVLREMLPYITSDHLVILITNAYPMAALERAIPARVAKVIPAVTQAIRSGVSLLIFGSRCSRPDQERLLELMGAISDPVVIEESQARIASDLTSCGPAFLCFVLQSFAQAARTHQPDLPASVINTMVVHMAKATCELISQTGCSFDDVITRVSTPGGITAEGIKVLQDRTAGAWEQVIETTIIKEAAKRNHLDL